jgi:hypothetical protein
MRGIAIVCLSLFAFAGCAFDVSEELPGDGKIASADGVADQESAPAEEELAAPEAGEADGVVTLEPTDEVVAASSPRYQVGDGTCHSFDYLRSWSNQHCRAVWSASTHAVSRDYQVSCGSGAKYVSFVCVD